MRVALIASFIGPWFAHGNEVSLWEFLSNHIDDLDLSIAISTERHLLIAVLSTYDGISLSLGFGILKSKNMGHCDIPHVNIQWRMRVGNLRILAR